MVNTLDKYKMIQGNIAKKKASADPYAYNKADTSGVKVNTPEQNVKV
jgi:hypothetical protein